MKFVSGEELREILDEKHTGSDQVPDFIVDTLFKINVDIDLFLLPIKSAMQDILEFVQTNDMDMDNTTIIYHAKNDALVHVAFLNMNWDSFVKKVKSTQKLKAFI